MAKDKQAELEKIALKRIEKDAKMNESLLIGLLWSDPLDTFGEFGHQLDEKDFLEKAYKFFYQLGREMIADGFKSLDELSVMKAIDDYNVEESFHTYGGLRTLNDLVNIVTETSDKANIEHYISRLKRNRVLMEAYKLYGAKAIIETERYPVSDMDGSDISAYWLDKSYKLQMDYNAGYEVEDLYIDEDVFLEELAKENDDMMPYHGLHQLQFAIGGIPKGKITMLGGFGGSGKSTLTAYSVITSILNDPEEKAIILLNEESAMDFRKKMIMVITAEILKKDNKEIKLDRRRLASGKLESKDVAVVSMAIREMNNLISESGRLKVVFVERYIMSDVETIIRRFANRGYGNLIIDTHKVSEESKHNARWETFVEDMKTYYRLTRKEAGGLNLRTFVTFQLADSAIHNRYLDFEAIGEGKAAKNEASVVIMFRKMWSDEYPDGKKALKVYKEERSNIPNKKTEYINKPVTLDKDKVYYLLFVPKNRYGQSNDTGLPVMVVQPDFNYGRFFDVGLTKIANNNN